MTQELQTLILAYRVVFLEKDVEKFSETYRGCNPERLMKLAAYHSVRPVLYQALRKAGVDDTLTRKLHLFATKMAMQDRLNGREVLRLLKLLEEAGIAALPYKGYLFTEKLYGGQHFRESGDMDIVIRDTDRAVEAINLLSAHGYQLKSSYSAEGLVANVQGREVSLIREDAQGMIFHLDFHWGVSENYNAYLLGIKECFEGAATRYFLGQECLLPSDEVLFKMLLNHHGGRGLWLRLKEIFDLSLFLKEFPDLQKHLSNWAGQVRMKRIYETGEMLNNRLLLNQDGRKLSLEDRVIVNVWEKGESYANKVVPKIKRLFVYFRLQDQEVNRWVLLKRLVSFHGSYNPVNDFPRPFGPRLEFLNFLTKLMVILYKRARGTYRNA